MSLNLLSDSVQANVALALAYRQQQRPELRLREVMLNGELYAVICKLVDLTYPSIPTANRWKQAQAIMHIVDSIIVLEETGAEHEQQ